MPAAGTQTTARSHPTPAPRGTVLIVEDDRTLGRLLDDVLTDEGYAVALLQNVEEEPVRDAVARLEPHCILLDSEGMAGYDQSWIDATWIRERDRPVPVVMFTVDAAAATEALAAESERSRRASFFAVLAKPFDLDVLLDTVARAVAASASAAASTTTGARRAALALDTAAGARAREQKPAPKSRTAQFARRHQLERLGRELTALQEALRRDRAEYLALEARTAGRALTPDERSLARELGFRAEANRLRLDALRAEFSSLT